MIDYILAAETQKLIQDHLFDDPNELRLKWSKSKTIDASAVVDQIISLKKARAKIPSLIKPGIIYPPPLSMEQCSSEAMASFKANLLTGDSMIDLTGGSGIDTFFFSKSFPKTVYVEKNAHLKDIASQNFEVWGASIETYCADAAEFLKGDPKVDLIYVDPSRRSGKKRVFLFQDTEPDVCELANKMLQCAPHVMIKASPLIDIQQAIHALPSVTNVWIVAVRNEVKEVLFLLGRDSDLAPKYIAKDLAEDFSFEFMSEEEKKCPLIVGVPAAGDFLYDPNRAILKAGAFKLIAKRFGLQKVEKNSHLYFSSEQMRFPGRVFQIVKVVDKRRLKGLQVDVISKNYAITANEFVAKYKLKPGNGTQFLIAFGRGKHAHAFLCNKVRPVE